MDERSKAEAVAAVFTAIAAGEEDGCLIWRGNVYTIPPFVMRCAREYNAAPLVEWLGTLAG